MTFVMLLLKISTDIRAADEKMLNSLSIAASKGKDNMKNIRIAQAGIAGKVIGEDIGVIKRDAFADFKRPTAEDKNEIG